MCERIGHSTLRVKDARELAYLDVLRLMNGVADIIGGR